MSKTKIFVASDPKSPYTNLHPFYQTLIENEEVALLYPTEIGELPKDFNGVIEHELDKRDMLKILESDILLFDYDTKPPLAWLVYGNISPVSHTIVISRSQTDLDPSICRKVRATLRSEDVYGFICYLLSSRTQSSSEDKSGPSPEGESCPNQNQDQQP